MAISPSEGALIVGATPRRSRFQIDKTVIIAYGFIAPAVFGFLIFYLLPTFRAIYISFTDWNLLRVPKVVGYANYDRCCTTKISGRRCGLPFCMSYTISLRNWCLV